MVEFMPYLYVIDYKLLYRAPKIYLIYINKNTKYSQGIVQ